MINGISSYVWGPFTAAAVLLCGVLISSLSGFPQLRVRDWLGNTAGRMLSERKNGRSQEGVTSFQTATAALAGTIGTGNIVGVAAALRIGGPPAIFWMVVSAAVSMGVSYSENRLGVEYRISDGRGGYIGGPMLYISDGLGMKKAARIWAVVCAFSAFSLGNITQVNTIAASSYNALNCPRWLSGAVVCAAAVPAVLGGVRGTVRLTEKLVPVMAAAYIMSCAALIIVNYRRVPDAFGMIFSGVLRPSAAAGGTLGSILTGVRRGVFTNEAGMGSSVMINASADSTDPHTAGCWGMFEVFADTVVMCSLTALALIVSGAYPADAGTGAVHIVGSAFAGIYGKGSGTFIAACLLLFAFSTLISWGVIGERAFSYAFGARYSKYYRTAYVLIIIPGALISTDTAWAAADIINALLLLPNIAAVTVLTMRACSRNKTAAKLSVFPGRTKKQYIRHIIRYK